MVDHLHCHGFGDARAGEPADHANAGAVKADVFEAGVLGAQAGEEFVPVGGEGEGPVVGVSLAASLQVEQEGGETGVERGIVASAALGDDGDGHAVEVHVVEGEPRFAEAESLGQGDLEADAEGFGDGGGKRGGGGARGFGDGLANDLGVGVAEFGLFGRGNTAESEAGDGVAGNPGAIGGFAHELSQEDDVFDDRVVVQAGAVGLEPGHVVVGGLAGDLGGAVEVAIEEEALKFAPVAEADAEGARRRGVPGAEEGFNPDKEAADRVGGVGLLGDGAAGRLGPGESKVVGRTDEEAGGAAHDFGAVAVFDPPEGGARSFVEAGHLGSVPWCAQTCQPKSTGVHLLQPICAEKCFGIILRRYLHVLNMLGNRHLRRSVPFLCLWSGERRMKP